MRYIVLALFLVGCGSEASQAEVTPLTNTHWSFAAAVGMCGVDVTFAGSDYTWVYECIQADGSSAYYVAKGAFAVDGDSVTTATRESTCAADHIVPTLTDTFIVDGDALHLSGGHGVMTLSASPKAIAPTNVGCFEAGGFVPRSLQPL